MSKHVEFVSYDGVYPNLCSGKLVLRINGKLYIFYYDTDKPEVDCRNFWYSGGGIKSDHDWNFTIVHAPWEFSKERLPEKLQKYADEIFEVFAENVEPGCCGGCC